jgi:predicted enzyme related to lactoylglutathione lyase
MGKVLGVGGVFFKSPDPQKLYEWYSRWLGIEFDSWGVFFLPNAIPPQGGTVFSAFPADTTYFDPSGRDYMFNLMVDNLDEVLAQVKEGGGKVLDEIMVADNGRFCWFMDPDGNKIELWEPA